MITFDVRAWLVWLFAGGLLAIFAGNPLYLVLLLLISRLTQYACAPVDTRGWRLPFWRISLMILVFSTIFNMFTAHIGRTVLYSLPSSWLLIGGPLTLEAAIYGFISGLRLITLLSFFLAFNTIVPVSELAALAPRALHELGLVVLIAITYVPETSRQFQRIRDAQTIRGHRLKGLRAWRPIIIPLLISSLERALNLAETMVARGYGSTTQLAMPLRSRIFLMLGLVLTLGGALILAWGAADGWGVLVAGILSIGWAYYDLGRYVARTRYRPRHWSRDDTLLFIGAVLPFVSLLAIPGLNRSMLAYFPYPQLAPPPFNQWVGASLFGLVIPAALAGFSRTVEERL